MSTPASLGSSEKKNIQNIDDELEEYLKEGKEDFSKIAHIRDELKELVKNKKIPEDVKQSLKEAMQDLHPMQPGQSVNLFDVQNAKTKLDDVLSAGSSDLE